jgi:basic amino acid/polyamine antiporter, APA family
MATSVRAPEQRATAEHGPGLRRALGFWEVTAGGVGIIIGAGIYVLVGEATAQAGEAVWVAFVLAGILSALTALSYCELASMYPSAASEYAYTRHAFPERFAFLVGWVMIGGLIVAAAAVSLGFARYLGHFLPLTGQIGAFALLALVSAIAATGIKQSARLTLTLSLIQIGGLVLIIAIGADHVGTVNLLDKRVAGGGILGAAALVFFAFIGFDEVTTLSEETRNPSRTIPRALLTALGISTVLYVAVAVSAVSVLGAEALGASQRPLTDVMAHALGGRSADVVAAIAIISTTNTTLLAITAASRVAYGMASAGALPASLAAVHRRRQTPVRAILLAALAAAAFTLLGDLTLVASVTDFAVYAVFLAVNATVVVLRLRAPATARPFRIPVSIGRVPLVPILGFAATILMVSQLEPRALLIGAALMGAGVAMAFLVRRKPD